MGTTSRRQLLKAIARVESQLYKQNIEQNRHQNYWRHWLQAYQPILIGMLVPAVILITWRSNGVKKPMRTAKKLLNLLTLSVIASVRTHISTCIFRQLSDVSS